MTEVEARRISLARHYATVGQPARVLETLDAGDVDLEDPDVWSLRAEALYDLDRYAEGADAAARGLALDPDEPGLLDLLALNQLELDDLAGAERSLLAALELWPEHPALLSHYALVCARGGQFDKARRLVERALQLAPDSADVLRVRAQVSYLAGDRRAAEREAAAVLELDPEDRVAHVLRGNVRVDDDDVYGAVRHFEKAARLDPSDREIAHVTRYNRTLTHWLQWPIYPIQRWGPLKVWAAYLVVLGLAGATGKWWIIAPIAILYVFMVVYSWTVAPLARWWLRRRI